MFLRPRSSSGHDLPAGAISKRARSPSTRDLQPGAIFKHARSPSRRHLPAGNGVKMHLPAANIKTQSSPPLSVWSSCDLPETDPIVTGHLWTTVARKMSRRGEITKSSSSNQLLQRRAYTSSAFDSNNSPRPRSLCPQQYAAFTEHILAPRHITIDVRPSSSRRAFVHFGTQKPISYRALDGLEAVSVLLELANDQETKIAAHYLFMGAKHLCEAEFATYATETFFLGEPRSSAPSEDRLWRAERMLQLVCPPQDNDQWLSPPLIEDDVAFSDDYSWDVRPACAYWISTRGFNEEYVHDVQSTCFVYQDWILCPYLTIEFKKSDNENMWAAQTQVVTAGAMALYNRYKLYSRANPEAADDDPVLTKLVHYAIVFAGPCYTIWKLRLNDLNEPKLWNGCCMGLIDRGNCTLASDVKRLVEWVNEIHRWGLLTHARACEMDVKRVMNHEGIETSPIE